MKSVSMPEKYQKFIIVQNAIIKNSLNQILVLRHHSSKKWLLPGGKINQGEKWFEALSRELHEEAGIDQFDIEEIMDTDSYFDEAAAYYIVTFICRIRENRIIVLSGEHDDYAWISMPSEVEKYDFWHGDIVKRINKYFSSQKNV